MPTPFMHLQAAARLAAEPWTAVATAERPAFTLGHIAPDYQALANVRRSATHFYRLPPAGRDEATRALLAAQPALAAAPELPADQAAFVAGYLGHLLLDLVWHFDVVEPYFLRSPFFSDPAEGHMLHLLLLGYLDLEARAGLADDTAVILAAAAPNDWTSFAPDAELIAWRDYVAAQLAPGAASRTAEIYAARLGLTAESFAACLDDPAWLERELFSRVPLADVQAALDAALPATTELTAAYLRGALRPAKAF